MRSSVFRRFSSVQVLAFLTTLVGAGVASADLVPPPIPECVGKPDGTFCKLADGTAGQCLTTPDSRRPGRSWQSCKKDEHECDRLAIGAECHGYLGRPAHCREFSDPEKNKRWRTCQVDETDSSGANSAAAATAPAVPAAPPPPGVATASAAPAKKGMFGCAVAPSGSADKQFLLFFLSLVLFAVFRRLRPAR